MNDATKPITAFADSKTHYQILDGLRGVAAVMVVIFHILETFTEGDHTKQIINHGYLAVDFFFVLSGFVIGYAYDDRWNRMSLGGFFKRRLIRLHPMIIMGMVIGAVLFYFQDCEYMKVSEVPLGKMLLVMVIGFTLIPVPVSMDIRGWQEMYPLNGPAWSLFFEYIANILYALVVRHFPKWLLSILVLVAGVALVHLAVTSKHGDVIGGWSLEPEQFRIGITRLIYPFFAGLLLSRVCKPGKLNNAFLWCSVLLIAVFSIPRIAAGGPLWINGLYDSFCIIIIFPLIVYMGASGKIEGKTAGKLSKFLGDISYPIYITHYPLIYVFTAWVVNKKATMAEAAPWAILLLVSSITIAWACVKFYDEPVRKWLMKKFMKR